MVRVTLNLRVRSGREQQFERVWETVAAVARRAPGNLNQTLLRNTRDTSCYVITSDWADQEDFHAFERSPEQDDLTAPIRALRVSASMDIYEVVNTVISRSASKTGSIGSRR